MGDYWIKLYHEIIDDPKMATLPDRLWRRTIELFLLAGKLSADKSGMIPDTRQLAWLLRIPTDDLQNDIDQLLGTGIIENIPGGYVVVNFEKRQSPSTGAERVQQYRERKRKQEYYGDVTTKKQNVTQNRLTESDTESDTETKQITNSSDLGRLIKAYESEIGPISQRVSEMIQDDLEDYGLQTCLDAIGIAVEQNTRKWSYVRGIIKRQWSNGKVVKKIDTQPPAKKKEYVRVEIDGEYFMKEVTDES